MAFAPPVVLVEQARPGLAGHWNRLYEPPHEPMQAYANLVGHLQVMKRSRYDNKSMDNTSFRPDPFLGTVRHIRNQSDVDTLISWVFL